MFRRRRSSVSASDFYNAILQWSPLGIILITATDSKVVVWSQKCTELLGFTSDETVGQSLTDTIIPLAFRAAHTRGIERYLQTHKSNLIGVKSIDVPALHKDGTQLQIRLSLFLLDEKEQQETFFIAFIQDLTAVNHLQKQLTEIQRAHDLMHSFFKGAAGPVCVLNSERRCIFSNETFNAMRGELSISEMLEEALLLDRLQFYSIIKREKFSLYIKRLGLYYDVEIVPIELNEQWVTLVQFSDTTERVLFQRQLDMAHGELRNSALQRKYLKALVQQQYTQQQPTTTTTTTTLQAAATAAFSAQIVAIEAHEEGHYVTLSDILDSVYEDHIRKQHYHQQQQQQLILETDLDMTDSTLVSCLLRATLQQMIDFFQQASSSSNTVGATSSALTLCVTVPSDTQVHITLQAGTLTPTAAQSLQHYEQPFLDSSCCNQVYILYRTCCAMLAEFTVPHHSCIKVVLPCRHGIEELKQKEDCSCATNNIGTSQSHPP